MCCAFLFGMCVLTGWLWLVGSIKLQVSFAKEPPKKDDILQKRPIIVSILMTVATPYVVCVSCYPYECAVHICTYINVPIIYVHTLIHVHMYIHSRMYICCSVLQHAVPAHMYIHSCMYLYYTCTYICTYICTFIHVPMNAPYIYIYVIHTYVIHECTFRIIYSRIYMAKACLALECAIYECATHIYI